MSYKRFYLFMVVFLLFASCNWHSKKDAIGKSIKGYEAQKKHIDQIVDFTRKNLSLDSCAIHVIDVSPTTDYFAQRKYRMFDNYVGPFNWGQYTQVDNSAEDLLSESEKAIIRRLIPTDLTCTFAYWGNGENFVVRFFLRLRTFDDERTTLLYFSNEECVQRYLPDIYVFNDFSELDSLSLKSGDWLYKHDSCAYFGIQGKGLIPITVCNYLPPSPKN